VAIRANDLELVMPHRPLGVTVLAILAGLAAVASVVHAFQFAGLLPFSLGRVQFFGASFLAAGMWGVIAFIWAWVAARLWSVDPRGWVFVLVLSFFNLVLGLLAVFGHSDWRAMAPALLVNGVVFLYALSPGVRTAFEGAAPLDPAATGSEPPGTSA
jgi:hypothetical protein